VNQFMLALSRHVQFFVLFFAESFVVLLLLRVESPDIEKDWSRRSCAVACFA
jgi:hypothetical protein